MIMPVDLALRRWRPEHRPPIPLSRCSAPGRGARLKRSCPLALDPHRNTPWAAIWPSGAYAIILDLNGKTEDGTEATIR